jgi:hypothetical protein
MSGEIKMSTQEMEKRESQAGNPVENHSPEQASNSVSSMRRKLVKTGWTAPVILAVTLPTSGFAANISGGGGSQRGDGQGDHQGNDGGGQGNNSGNQDGQGNQNGQGLGGLIGWLKSLL